MSWIATGIAGGTALIKGVSGIVQNNKASKLEKNNPFPTYTVDPAYQQNVNQAQNMSQTGIPQTAFNNQLNSINQNQASALNAFNGNNGRTSLASIVRQGDNATGNLNAQDAVQRNQNMLNLLRQRTALAQQRDKAWDWNSQQKYLGNLAKSQALRGSANANINGAINDVGSLGSTIAANGGFGGDDTVASTQTGVGQTVQSPSYVAPTQYPTTQYPKNSFYGNFNQ